MSSISAAVDRLTKYSLFITEFTQDLLYYIKYCGVSPFQNTKKKIFYKLIIEAHAIEKGLSLAKPRLLFGQKKIASIVGMARQYGLSSDDFPVLMAVGVLQTYLSVHNNAGLKDPLLDDIARLLEERSSLSSTKGNGGLRHFPAGLCTTNGRVNDRAALLRDRFSCRMFADEPVDASAIQEIVALAQSAPSQCNRQATKVHFYDDAPVIASLLQLQQGSSGFSESVRGLFVISFDLAAWGGAQQRNQGYVDAALFAQNLMLAAHSKGLASCPLNLAIRHSAERCIRKAGGIPSDQRLVMMIAVGKPLAGILKGAASPRRPLADILTQH